MRLKQEDKKCTKCGSYNISISSTVGKSECIPYGEQEVYILTMVDYARFQCLDCRKKGLIKIGPRMKQCCGHGDPCTPKEIEI